MTRRGLLYPGAAQSPPASAGRPALLEQGPAHEDYATADGVTVLDADDPGDAERARLRRKAGVHTQVAGWISGLIEGNTASCGDLRRRLAVLRVPGAPPSAARAAAAVEQEIQMLDRIIAHQARTAGWHLGEARRLRGLAGRASETEGPAALAVPGRTISGETTRQPDGGQAGGA
jgi:hypothetical protein